MAHSFKWTFSPCCMSFHLNLQQTKLISSNVASINMQSFHLRDLWGITFDSLDYVLEDLQTKVSHNSWLSFVG